MPMSRHDAELVYDGRIPPGVIDDRIPSQLLAQANAVRLGAVKPKPAAILASMAAKLAHLMMCGCATEADLERAGFTPAEIREHRADAMRLALMQYPTLDGLEWAA